MDVKPRYKSIPKSKGIKTPTVKMYEEDNSHYSKKYLFSSIHSCNSPFYKGDREAWVFVIFPNEGYRVQFFPTEREG